MSQMTATHGMLQAILREPRADDLRLIFADWLAENGEDEYGEFVRLQVELPRVIRESFCHHNLTMPRHCPACVLRRRERELLGRWQGRWTMDLLDLMPVVDRSPLLQQVAHDAMRAGAWPSEDVMFRFRRGLVEEISLTLADFLTHAQAIFSAAPVLKVALTGREPTQFRAIENGGFWRWFDGSRGVLPDSDDPDELPRPLWQAYHQVTVRAAITWQHPTRKHALAYLSHACVAYGRQQAGLPPLEVTEEDVRR